MVELFRRIWPAMSRYGRVIWNGPFYIGPLVQPVSLGSALMKVLEVWWRALLIVLVGGLAFGIVGGMGAAVWTVLKPAPQNQEECKEVASERGATDGMLANCERQFPAVRRDDGTYAYLDSETGEWTSVSGPKLSPEDKAKIEATRQGHWRELTSKHLALAKVVVEKYSITCNDPSPYILCYNKDVTVRLKNNSDRDMNGLHFTYEIGRGLDCSGALAKSFQIPMRVKAGQTGSFVHNLGIGESGPDGVMEGCLHFEGADEVL
jgi:hypothetical protein